MDHPKKFKLLEEHRKKISESLKGRTPTDETKKKMSISRTGEKNPMYGRHHSEETKRKISNSKKGTSLSEETRRKMSLAQRGKEHLLLENTKIKISNALKGRKLSDKHKKNISLKMRGDKNPFYGRKHTEEFKINMRITRKKLVLPNHHTKPELKFMDLIKKYDLPYKYVGDGKFWIENINPDFIECNGKKIAVEIFGDYWHDTKLNPNLNFRSTEKCRKETLAKYGWKCIVIWESELKKLSDEEILNKIQNTLSFSESK